MVTDTYSKIMSEIPKRPMLINEFGEDLGLLLREQKRQQEASEREKELNLYRSGSAPPTVEGSLNAIGGLFDASELLGFRKNGGEGFIAEEEIRADPAYMNYYYSNVNLNPRLPPPLLSKEDWRFAQRLQGGNGGGGSVVGGIVDRMKVGNSSSGERSNSNTSLFSVQPGIDGKEDNKVESTNRRVTEWGGDGLIGLPGLGLRSQQKSFAELIQDDVNRTKILSRHPSRPASRNAFDNDIETSEAQFGFLHNDLASVDSFRSGGNKLAMSTVQNIGSSASHSYASALGASLSRSTTPDPQRAARAPSPRIPSAVVRSTCMDKRSATGQNSIIGVSPHVSESEDLVIALSGMNLSANGMRDEENHVHPQIHSDIDNHHNLFNVHGDQNYSKQNSYLNKSDSRHFNLHSHRQSAKGSYQNMGKNSAVGMDVNNYSLMSNEQHGLNNSANSCLKGPPSPILNGRGSSSSHYQNVDSTFSPLPNYGLSGYAGSPTSPSFMGSPLGTGSLPPLYESAAVASAMGYTDSGAFGGGLSLGPNMLAVATEFQRNHSTGNALQVPLMDPMYLQYLRSNEYAAQAATSNDDPRMDVECMSNPYMDLLQKAYLGALLSPQKSQFNVPYIGKSGGLNHGYCGNPSFGHGMSYPGSPLASPVYPNSPVGPGSPARHSERNLRFSSGTRNMTGFMGGWRSESGGNLDEGFPSSLLDEFKSNKTKCFELSDIADHVVEFSADQYGSRFIQQKLETSTTEEKNMVFNEIMPQALALMTGVFGNYVIQKFFEHGTASQIRELADQLAGHVLTLSLQMYGCRVIQKAIEVVDMNQQTKMVTELDGHIMRCVRDQNGNHVIQKCIECVPEDAIQFIVSTFYDQVIMLTTHPYGCRVIQRVLEHCHNPKTQQIMMDEILRSVCMLAQDQYGNYVVQHLLEHGKPHERTAIINKLTGQIVQMSQQKFASNVIEKCLSFGTLAERQSVVNEMLGSNNENDPLQEMMKDQFANYVVQKVLETCDDQQLELILTRIKVHLNALKKYTYGKHIVARVEKLVAAGERRISFLTPQPASTA